MDPQESAHDKEKIERLRQAMYSRTLSEKMTERPRQKMDEIRPIVGEDWKRNEPQIESSMVAPRSIGVARKALWWVLGLSAIFFIAAAGFFAYYFAFGGGSLPAAAENIDIIVAGPPQIAGGEPTQLQITVTNRNNVPLQLADLVINYPAGTRSPTDLVSDLSSQRISLGAIEPGGRRQGTVTAVFAGSGGSESTVQVDLEYRLAGSSALFVASEDYHANFNSSPLSVSVESNTETVSGQPVEFTVTVASNANTVVKDVLLTSTFPFGFTFKSADPAVASSGVWTLGDIAPGQKRIVVVRGTQTGESGDERVFRFDAGTRKDPKDQRISTILAQNSFRMKVSSPFLGLSVAVNKVSGAGAAVAPGDNVNVVVTWQNNLPTAVTDAVIVARLSGIQIDGTSVHSLDGFYRSSDNVVLWDKTTTGGTLGSVASGARGTVAFSFKMPTTEELQNIRNPSLTVTVNAAGKRLSETNVPENLQSTVSQRVAIASDLQIAAQGLYYANPFGSSGPMPPKSGVETTYAIVFTLTNTTNKISNAKLTATLPPYVRWIGICSPREECEAPGSKITFNQVDSTVTWDIGDITPGIGLNGEAARQAAIAIGFTPSTSQIGQEPPLLQDISLVGIDASTGEKITKSVRNVTTNIAGDPGFNTTNATVVK